MDNDKLRLAATLIEQSPPGQVNDVLRDLQIILNDDSGTVKQYFLDQLRNYNLQHLQTICLPGTNEQSVLCEAAVIPGSGSAERYVEPRSRKSFLFDHVTHEISDLEDYTIPESDEAFRAALDKSLKAYLRDHYASSSSAGAVFSSSVPDVPISAVSTIASEDAEEEREALQEGQSLGVGEEDGAKTPTEETTMPASTGGEESIATEAVVPGNEHGNSLLEKVAESMEAVVIAAEETLLGDKDATSSTEATQEHDTEKSSAAEDAGPVVQAETAASADGGEQMTAVEASQSANPAEKATSAVDTETTTGQEPSPVVDPTYTIAIVGNKYNTQNFWTGQWRSVYTVDPKSGSITGRINVDVHYFENGNVQLAAKEDVSLSLEVGGQNMPSAIVTAIAKNEQEYQMKLNATYDDLGEKNFKSLRRPLPITRQRVEWEKIAAYKAGGGQLSK